MKLRDLMEAKTETQPAQKGTYAAVRFDSTTKLAIKKYIEENDIPNGTDVSKLHCTLLYSRKYLPDYVPKGEYAAPLVGTSTGLEVWEAQPDETGHRNKCLVLKFDCPELAERHKKLMKEHEGTYDYDEYKTHVTLSYDIGDMDIADLPDIRDSVEKLYITEEYGEDLNLNWAKEKSREQDDSAE